MKNNKLKRLTIIYYTAMILVLSVVSIKAYYFSLGFSEGMDMAQVEAMAEGKKHFNRQFGIDLKIKSNAPYPITIQSSADNSLIVTARPVMIDLQIESKQMSQIFTPRGIFGAILSFVITFSYIAIFVLVIMLFRSVKKNIDKQVVFAEKNIRLMRTIAYLMIGITIFHDIYVWNYLAIAQDYLQGSGYDAASFWTMISFKEILMGLVILFMAEISAIACPMEEEQQFTI